MFLTQPPAQAGRARWLGSCLTIALLGYLAMQEVGAIIGDVAVQGVSYPASSLYSVFEVGNAATAMNAWATASCAVPIKAWLYWLLAFDLVFIVGYAGIGIGATARWGKTLKIGRLAWALVLTNLTGDVLAFVAIRLMPADCAPSYHPPALFGLLVVVTVVKTGLALAIALRVGWVVMMEDRAEPAGQGHPHHMLRQIIRALGIQRFIVIIVALLAGLLLLHGVPILEQGIDVERGWVLTSDHWLGFAWATWAAALIVLLSCGLRYLASVRAAPVVIPPPAQPQDPGGPSPGKALDPQSFRDALKNSAPWLASTALIAVVLFALGKTPFVRVYWASAICLVIVLAAVPVLSVALARVTSTWKIDVESDHVRERAWQIGRALAWSVPAILLLSVCRSLTAPMMLLPPGQRTECAVVFGLAAVAALGWVFYFLGHNSPERVRKRDNPRIDKRWWNIVEPQLVGAQWKQVGAQEDAAEGGRAPGLLLSITPSVVVTIACAIPLLIFPVHTSRFLSVIGTVGLSLLLLSAFYATLQILAQLTDPPRVFLLLGLRRAPVVTLVLLIGLLSTVVATGTSLHDIREPVAWAKVTVPPSPDRRPSLQAALSTWLGDQSAGCALTLPGGTGAKVQPLVLVAAEGGGVRAAWWTVDVMSSLTSTDCGRRSIFLTSGVSGGAAGLAMMGTSSRPYAQMQAIAGPDALAAATGGLLSRDMFAGGFGLNVRAADGPAGVPFPDRAAFIEQTWERQAPGLSDRFPLTGQARTVPWYTVFNGSSVAGHCRVLISDVRLTRSTRCDDPADPMPGSYDLFEAEPCDRGVDTATAALLAGRFPYITPSGVITSCDASHAFRDQIIDGGYSENSGIETLDQALIQLMPSIRAHNELALRTSAPLVVPLVVFLHNTVVTVGGAQPRPPAASPEIVVPLTKLTGSSILGSTTTLMQAASVISADWVPGTAPSQQAADLRAGALSLLGGRAVTVAPQRQPAMALPLGWTLSLGTRESLDAAFNAYLTCQPADSLTCAQSRTFDALLAQWGTLLRFPPHPR